MATERVKDLHLTGANNRLKGTNGKLTAEAGTTVDLSAATVVLPAGQGGGGGSGMANPMTAVADLIVGGTAGTPVRLPKGSAGQVLTVLSDGTLGWVTPATGGGGGGGTTLAYVSDGDANGLFYALGVIQGGNGWTNPAGTAVLTVTANGPQLGSASDLLKVTDRQTGNGLECVIENGGGVSGQTGHWVQFDLGVSRQIHPSKVSFRQRGGDNGNGAGAFDGVTQVRVDGSGDGVTMTAIATVNFAHLGVGAWNTLALPASVPFRFLRVTQTAASNNGAEPRFGVGEIEFYGVLTTS